HQARRTAVRILYAGPDHVGDRADRRAARRPRGDPRSDERQPVPLRRLSQHRRGHRGGGGTMTAPPFNYARPSGIDDALAAAAAPGAMYLAGGTDLLQLWKAAVVAPTRVVDISRLALNTITSTDRGLELGALAHLSDVARDADVVGKYA